MQFVAFFIEVTVIVNSLSSVYKPDLKTGILYRFYSTSLYSGTGKKWDKHPKHCQRDAFSAKQTEHEPRNHTRPKISVFGTRLTPFEAQHKQDRKSVWVCVFVCLWLILLAKKGWSWGDFVSLMLRIVQPCRLCKYFKSGVFSRSLYLLLLCGYKYIL